MKPMKLIANRILLYVSAMLILPVISATANADDKNLELANQRGCFICLSSDSNKPPIARAGAMPTCVVASAVMKFRG